MPIDYSRDDTRRRLTVRAHGVVTLKDLLVVLERQAAEETWTYALLYDAREAESLGTTQEVRALVDHVTGMTAARGPRGPVALVAPQDASFGMGRMYSTLSESVPIQMGVFRDLGAADKWLSEQVTT